jgi:hypothetical protein
MGIIRTQFSPHTKFWIHHHTGKQDSDLKSLLMTMIKDFKKDGNNSLKEIQENTGKQLEALKEGIQKSLKELQQNTIKQLKEMSKTIQDPKMEIETMKKRGDNNGDRKPRNEIRKHRSEHQQQIWKRESQMQKIPYKTWTQQSKKMQNPKSS